MSEDRHFKTAYGEPVSVVDAMGGVDPVGIEYTIDGQHGFLWLDPSTAREVAAALLLGADAAAGDPPEERVVTEGPAVSEQDFEIHIGRVTTRRGQKRWIARLYNEDGNHIHSYEDGLTARSTLRRIAELVAEETAIADRLAAQRKGSA